MDKVFVTGATGFIGTSLCHKLADKGYVVHALYRSEEKAKRLNRPDIHLYKGDIFNADTLEKAMSSCQGIFHLAAYARIWAKDKYHFYNTNVEGTHNVIKAAHKAGIKRAVFVSTAGVLGPSTNMPITEETERQVAYFNNYESTKAIADQVIMEIKAFDPIIVYPTRVYGPGLLSESNSTTSMIKDYINGKWHIIPANGKAIGNYVYVDDVVNGLLLAYQNGKPYQRYLLSGSNISYHDFFRILSQLSGKSHRLYHIPSFVIKSLAYCFVCASKLTGKPPKITPGLVKKFLCNWETSCIKAEKELGYEPVDISEGIKRTIDWLNSQHV